MKLELKHLAGYLPYELKGIFTIYNTEQTVRSLSVIYINRELEYRHFKPILRPLLELEKEDWNSIFVNSDIDNILSIYQSDKHLGCVEYYLVNLLLSHHFDIYGLIEKELAIDINTLNK